MVLVYTKTCYKDIEGLHTFREAFTMLYYEVCHLKPVELHHAHIDLPPVMSTESRTSIATVVARFRCVVVIMSDHVLKMKWTRINHQSLWWSIRPTSQHSTITIGTASSVILPEGFHLSSLSKYQLTNQPNKKVFLYELWQLKEHLGRDMENQQFVKPLDKN